MIALLEASLLRPLGLVVVAWLILRVLKVRHPASRHAVWTTVLAGMLVLPILTVVTPHWTMPVLPPAQTEVQTQTQGPVTSSVTPPEIAGVPEPATPLTQALRAGSPQTFPWPSFETLVVGGYVAGLLTMLMYRFAGWLLLRRVVSRSTLLRPRCLRESSDVLTPVAVGVLSPSVILPDGWRQWSGHTRRAVLAHEFAHLRRRDTLVAGLARFVTCVFWFHPAAWWVSRQTADLAELACDAVALERVGDPAGYSRVLLEFAETVNRTGRRVALPGLAMASGSRMSERIDEVFKLSAGTMRKLRQPRVWLVAIGLPALYLAATVVVGARSPLPVDLPITTADKPLQPSITPTPTVAAVRLQSSLPVRPSPDQKFDLATVKPCPRDAEPPPGRSGGWPKRAQVTPGFARWECLTVAELVFLAYAQPNTSDRLLNNRNGSRPGDPEPVRKGPSWAYSERFTIEAKAPAAADQATLTGPMLRALLEDRFQLKTHRATDDVPVYVLTLLKGGVNAAKVKPTAPNDCVTRMPGVPPEKGYPCGGQDYFDVQGGNTKRVRWTGTTLKDFLNANRGLMDRLVIDKTGLDGQYNIEFDFVPDENTPGYPWPDGVTAGGGPSIFKALEGLGLHLEPSKAPGEHIAIDRVERPK